MAGMTTVPLPIQLLYTSMLQINSGKLGDILRLKKYLHTKADKFISDSSINNDIDNDV
jgi:hypothetical protein